MGSARKMAYNITEDDNQNIQKELFCSPELTKEIHLQLVCLSVFNILLSLTAFFGNVVILIALHNETSLHPSTKLLFRCLATSDLCVGLLSEPLIVSYWMSIVTGRFDICPYALASNVITSLTLCSVSLLTLTALSVDRLFALILEARYRHIVTFKRTMACVIFFWVVSVVSTTSYFWNYVITVWYRYIGVLLCILVSTFAYAKSFIILHRYTRQLQTDYQPAYQPKPRHLKRYISAIYTALWLQFALVICYLPFGITEALTSQIGLSSSFFVVRESAATLVFLNSSLNPILYYWKIRAVRQRVKVIVKKLSRQQQS
ncbi:melanocyte-stimulating hormone receptor-like [Montipora foliosa]|uniref:melanocyte-stimulating hormone receptor-like n=1 Tax=Montipora foliosa TaxID=591990 RepID=UPI0035F2121E